MIPEFSTLPLELLHKLQGAIPPGKPIYLVGGAVRDALLRRPCYDLDFVVAEGAIGDGRRVADRLGAAFYPLDAGRDIGRVIYSPPEGPRTLLDFAGMQGPDLESDLRLRDFTINAMALPLPELSPLIDPLGGARDLKDRVLRLASGTSFLDDPVRVARAIRQAVAFELQIPPETRQQLHIALPGLATVSAERIRDELFRILEGPRPATALRGLDILGALAYILPELEALKAVPAAPPHTLDGFNHTLETAQRLNQVIEVLSLDHHPERAASWALGLISLRLGRFRQRLHEHLAIPEGANRSPRGLILLGALYHDVGKPETHTVEESGKVRYLEHERIGAEMAVGRARSLALSNQECQRLATIVLSHMRPLHLAQADEGPTRRAIHRYFRATGPAGVDICLLSLADLLATYGAGLPEQIWTRHLDVVRDLLSAWWEKPEEAVSPPPLLDGNDLMEALKLRPGPVIGELLSLIRENQASGEIHTSQDALEFAAGWLQRNVQG